MSKFKTWKEVRKTLNITPEQEEEIRIESEIIKATIKARKNKKPQIVSFPKGLCCYLSAFL